MDVTKIGDDFVVVFIRSGNMFLKILKTDIDRFSDDTLVSHEYNFPRLERLACYYDTDRTFSCSRSGQQVNLFQWKLDTLLNYKITKVKENMVGKEADTMFKEIKINLNYVVASSVNEDIQIMLDSRRSRGLLVYLRASSVSNSYLYIPLSIFNDRFYENLDMQLTGNDELFFKSETTLKRIKLSSRVLRFKDDPNYGIDKLKNLTVTLTTRFSHIIHKNFSLYDLVYDNSDIEYVEITWIVSIVGFLFLLCLVAVVILKMSGEDKDPKQLKDKSTSEEYCDETMINLNSDINTEGRFSSGVSLSSGYDKSGSNSSSSKQSIFGLIAAKISGKKIKQAGKRKRLMMIENKQRKSRVSHSFK